MLLRRHLLLACLSLPLLSSAAWAQTAAEPCEGQKERAIPFSNMEANDTLLVSVKGNPCSAAEVIIKVTNAAHETLYSYTGAFIEHMPFIIYEPELNTLVDIFIDRVITEATRRFTRDLPPYTNRDTYYEENNDFMLIPISQYNALRQHNQPILWHTTGDTTWVSIIYDTNTNTSKVIMRGGIFQAKR